MSDKDLEETAERTGISKVSLEKIECASESITYNLVNIYQEEIEEQIQKAQEESDMGGMLSMITGMITPDMVASNIGKLPARYPRFTARLVRYLNEMYEEEGVYEDLDIEVEEAEEIYRGTGCDKYD